MLPDEKKKCHLTGFKTSCRKLVADGACQGRWTLLRGNDPDTGGELNRYGCIDEHAHTMRLDLIRRTSGVAASVESRGNKTNDLIAEGMLRDEFRHRQTLQLAGIDIENALSPLPKPEKSEEPVPLQVIENRPAEDTPKQ